jgi:2-polyprenyl-6-methoxyphenol hydroxylase-like FAD-dependent oxidoreductase
MPHEQNLKVIIVGAGIAGLTAAISLRQNGHTVEICEASSFAREVGAGITIGPNANCLLRRLGIKPEEQGGIEAGRV